MPSRSAEMPASPASKPRPATRRPPRKKALWRDHTGRVSPLKIAALVLLCLPALVLSMQWQQGLLGARPVTEMIDGAGLWTIRLLFISLAISPATALLEWPGLMTARRMVGVACALYGAAHLTLYALDEKWQLLQVASEILLRFYLTIGFVALLGLAILAITSTDGWVRKLRANWVRLHSAIYGIALLGTVHFFLQSKADVTEAVLMAGFLFWLLIWRLLPRGWRQRVVVLLPLAPLVGLLTALLEAGWYHFATGVNAAQVLDANLDIDFGLRPALWVAIVAAGIALATAARRSQLWLARRRRGGMVRSRA
jgi:sulfoxide reductase heme-binding subunit YedZ